MNEENNLGGNTPNPVNTAPVATESPVNTTPTNPEQPVFTNEPPVTPVAPVPPTQMPEVSVNPSEVVTPMPEVTSNGMTDNGMVNPPSEVNENKRSKGTKITLVILGIVIVALITLAVYWFLIRGSGSTENIYYKAIDSLASSLNQNVTAVEENFQKQVKVNSNITLNLKTSDSDMKKVFNILNNMELDMDIAMDYQNKIANMDYNIKYNKNSLLNASMYLYDQDAYMDLKNLYNRPIKISNEEVPLDMIWKMYDFESYKTLITGITNALKSSLKVNYFTTKNETINVLGQKVKTTKHILTLTPEDINNFYNDFYNYLVSDQLVLNALAKITDSEIDEVKKGMESTIDNVAMSDDTFVSEIYVSNSNTIEKVVIKVNDSALTFNKVEENKFNIVTNSSDQEEKVGELEIKEDGISFTIDDAGDELTIELSKNTSRIAMDMFDAKMEIKLTTTDENGNVEITVNNSDLDANVKITYEKEETSNISKKSVSNAIEMDKLTQNDYNTIMQNIYSNSTLMSLLQSVIGLDQIPSYDTNTDSSLNQTPSYNTNNDNSLNNSINTY